MTIKYIACLSIRMPLSEKNMLVKPSPPMTKRIVQVATVGDNSVLQEVERDVLDKDVVDFVE